jgi:hypothetical protein
MFEDDEQIDAADGERNQRNDESFLPVLHPVLRY